MESEQMRCSLPMNSDTTTLGTRGSKSHFLPDFFDSNSGTTHSEHGLGHSAHPSLEYRSLELDDDNVESQQGTVKMIVMSFSEIISIHVRRSRSKLGRNWFSPLRDTNTGKFLPKSCLLIIDVLLPRGLRSHIRTMELWLVTVRL